jgi:hypothetical protein
MGEQKAEAVFGLCSWTCKGWLVSGNVQEVSLGDREGGKRLLLPRKATLPRLQVIWAESGSAASPREQWVKEHLELRLDIVNHPWTGLRGVWHRKEQ